MSDSETKSKANHCEITSPMVYVLFLAYFYIVIMRAEKESVIVCSEKRNGKIDPCMESLIFGLGMTLTRMRAQTSCCGNIMKPNHLCRETKPP